jgi:chromosome segregation ATPase
MEMDELQELSARVEKLVEDLKTARHDNESLVSEKKSLEQKLSVIERQVHRAQKEGDRTKELTAQNKAYKKKCALLKSRVDSMLAKVDALQ